MLVKAFRHLDEASASLAIIGPDDGQLEEVEQLIHQFGLEGKVILPGLLTGAIYRLRIMMQIFSSYLAGPIHSLGARWKHAYIISRSWSPDSCEMAPLLKIKSPM